MQFQKKVYDDFNERTRLECKMAAKIFDYDLKSHLEQLEAYHIKGNDFQPLPLKDVQHEFVYDLLHKYLQDIKHRMKAGEFGRATAATLLRKCVKLEDIEYMVEDSQAKSNELLSNADKLAEELAAKRERKKIEKNIKRLNTKRLEYNQESCFKRRTSWKGKTQLLMDGFHKDALEDKIRRLGRAKSRKTIRTNVVRKIPKEHYDLPGKYIQTVQSIGMEDEDDQYMEQDAGKTAGSSMAPNAAGTTGEPTAALGDMQAQFQQMMLLMQGQAQAAQNAGAEGDKNAPLFNINSMMMGQ